MNDEHEILVHKSKNVESARQIRFNNVSEVKSQQKILKEYILHAIEKSIPQIMQGKGLND